MVTSEDSVVEEGIATDSVVEVVVVGSVVVAGLVVVGSIVVVVGSVVVVDSVVVGSVIAEVVAGDGTVTEVVTVRVTVTTLGEKVVWITGELVTAGFVVVVVVESTVVLVPAGQKR